MAKTRITIEAAVNASLQKAWDYWTLPEHITKWNFASDDWHCPKAENNPVSGGSFSFTMASKDGKMSFDFEGKYDHVETLKNIEYTMADGRMAQVDFKQEGNSVLITETFDPESENPLDLQRDGWQSIMDNFKKYTENN